MADRIGVMHDGRLVQVGTPAEVYERPNSRFVAEFLGAANILPITRADGMRSELSERHDGAHRDAGRADATVAGDPARARASR